VSEGEVSIRELVSDRGVWALLIRAERGGEEQQGLLGVGGQKQRAQWHAWRVSMQNEEEKAQGRGKEKGHAYRAKCRVDQQWAQHGDDDGTRPHWVTTLAREPLDWANYMHALLTTCHGLRVRGTEGLSKEKPKDALELYYKATAGIACGCAGMDSPATLCMNEPLPVQKKYKAPNAFPGSNATQSVRSTTRMGVVF
jgi:hypothetical protein